MSVAGSDMVLGAISFGHALAHDWRDDEPSLREMYEAACRTIVRMECEAEEREARIAVLEEEQKILAERFDARLHAVGTTAEAKAAVIEGGTGYSGAERPEPSPHLSAALDRLATIASEAFGPFPVQSAEENLKALEIGIFNLRADFEMAEAERIEMAKMLRSEREAHAKCQNELDGYRDEACREKCRDKAAADGGWANI